MRIAFISRATLYTAPGGDTKQVEETAGALRNLGVEVQIFTAGSTIDYSRFDLLHFFNIIRPADILGYTRKTDLPYVVSTIFVDYAQYEKTSLAGGRKILSTLVSADGMEYIKALARWAKNGEAVQSGYYLLHGHRAAVKKVATGAALLLPNSESEYQRFAAAYRVQKPYHVVPNGVSEGLIHQAPPPAEPYRNAVLCAARIEGGKNQLNLIRALNGTSCQLHFFGKSSPNNGAYYEACRQEAAPNIHFEGQQPEAVLAAAFTAAKVHVLPSYFETTGLSSLEAAALGCNIVITDRGDTREYFGDYAWYCNPEDPASILEAVKAAFAAPYNPAFRQHILDHYTWKRAGEETLAAYRKVLPNFAP